MLILSAIVLTAIIALQFSVAILHESVRLDPGNITAWTVIGVFLLVVGWSIWVAFFSVRNLGLGIFLGLCCLALPILFQFAFGPVLSGDLSISRFDGWLFRKPETSVESQPIEGVKSKVDITTVSANDFSGFLGNDRTGVIASSSISSDWSQNKPQLMWRRGIGKGWSGISVVNGWAVTMEQLGPDECVTCYAVDSGAPAWRYSHRQRHEDFAGLGKAGPRSTPTLVGGMVYAQGAAGVLVCLNGADGSVVWSRDLCEILNIDRTTGKSTTGFEYLEEKSTLAWGRAASPLVVDDLVFVPGGGPINGPFSTLLAFDKKSGDLIWKAGDEMIGYGSPSHAVLAGVPQILLVGEKAAFGFDPGTGKQLWSHARPGESNARANCSQVTVVSPNEVLLTKAYGLGGELLKLNSNDGAIDVTSVWKSTRVLTTKFANPVIRDGHAYALADGFLECVDVATGKLVWTLRKRFGHGQLLLVGDQLIIHSEFGKLCMIPAEPKKPESPTEIETISGVCWNTICLAGDKLIVRSDLEMACFRLPSQANGAESQ